MGFTMDFFGCGEDKCHEFKLLPVRVCVSYDAFLIKLNFSLVYHDKTTIYFSGH